ncbi:protein YgfX [Solemya velesiana gill symbiont]|uniref:Uncharacterized protein n=1 Tax=Solemya velesiana gill symbiont TaxID=1918948 RepID=A0A1T2KWZ6_9GAMM|nr:protein YgfX [Solemya velesiana gill symbiont]OOZ37365.1 hypothetical protein BOW51_02620 [Solemya velesiana gill symbiont]
MVLGCGPVILLVSAFFSWRHQIRNNQGISAIESDADGRWTLYDQNGEEDEVQLMPSTLVLPWLIIFHFRGSPSWRRQLLVPWDAADPEMLRCFRVRLLDNPQTSNQPGHSGAYRNLGTPFGEQLVGIYI